MRKAQSLQAPAIPHVVSLSPDQLKRVPLRIISQHELEETIFAAEKMYNHGFSGTGPNGQDLGYSIQTLNVVSTYQGKPCKEYAFGASLL